MFASPTRTFMPMALLAAVAMTCLQGAAFAGPAPEVRATGTGIPMEATHRTTQVSAADLNLADPAHVAKLDARIERAAEKVCPPENNRDLKAVSNHPVCKRTAIGAATSRRDVLVAKAQSEQLAARQASEPATN